VGDIRAQVLVLARSNPGWGYTKIRDALRGLKIEIGRTTVANLLAQAGIEPAPKRNRKRTWKQFLKSHWETLYACDFFSVEVLSAFGIVRHMVFFVMEVKSRAVQIAGIHIAPDGDWMKQVARNLVDPVDGFLRNASYLIHDRDPVFTKAWTALLERCSLLSEQPSLGVGEVERFAIQARAQHAVLCAQVLDRLALLASDPAGEKQDEELKRGGGHGHRRYQSSAASRVLSVIFRRDRVRDATAKQIAVRLARPRARALASGPARLRPPRRPGAARSPLPALLAAAVARRAGEHRRAHQAHDAKGGAAKRSERRHGEQHRFVPANE
jgi:hypothetical protein